MHKGRKVVKLPTYKGPQPPEGLSEKAVQLWRDLQLDFPLDDAGGKLLLETLLRAMDRADYAGKLLEKEGIIVKDRFGQPSAHPAVRVERDARAAMLSALRAMNLDITPARLTGRSG